MQRIRTIVAVEATAGVVQGVTRRAFATASDRTGLLRSEAGSNVGGAPTSSIRRGHVASGPHYYASSGPSSQDPSFMADASRASAQASSASTLRFTGGPGAVGAASDKVESNSEVLRMSPEAFQKHIRDLIHTGLMGRATRDLMERRLNPMLIITPETYRRVLVGLSGWSDDVLHSAIEAQYSLVEYDDAGFYTPISKARTANATVVLDLLPHANRDGVELSQQDFQTVVFNIAESGNSDLTAQILQEYSRASARQQEFHETVRAKRSGARMHNLTNDASASAASAQTAGGLDVDDANASIIAGRQETEDVIAFTESVAKVLLAATQGDLKAFTTAFDHFSSFYPTQILRKDPNNPRNKQQSQTSRKSDSPNASNSEDSTTTTTSPSSFSSSSQSSSSPSSAASDRLYTASTAAYNYNGALRHRRPQPPSRPESRRFEAPSVSIDLLVFNVYLRIVNALLRSGLPDVARKVEANLHIIVSNTIAQHRRDRHTMQDAGVMGTNGAISPTADPRDIIQHGLNDVFAAFKTHALRTMVEVHARLVQFHALRSNISFIEKSVSELYDRHQKDATRTFPTPPDSTYKQLARLYSKVGDVQRVKLWSEILSARAASSIQARKIALDNAIANVKAKIEEAEKKEKEAANKQQQQQQQQNVTSKNAKPSANPSATVSMLTSELDALLAKKHNPKERRTPVEDEALIAMALAAGQEHDFSNIIKVCGVI